MDAFGRKTRAWIIGALVVLFAFFAIGAVAAAVRASQAAEDRTVVRWDNGRTCWVRVVTDKCVENPADLSDIGQ